MNKSNIKLRIFIVCVIFVATTLIAAVFFYFLVLTYFDIHDLLLLTIDKAHDEHSTFGSEDVLKAIQEYADSINMIWVGAIALFLNTVLFIYCLASLIKRKNEQEKS